MDGRIGIALCALLVGLPACGSGGGVVRKISVLVVLGVLLGVGCGSDIQKKSGTNESNNSQNSSNSNNGTIDSNNPKRFDDGVYLIVSSIEVPLPGVLQLFVDVKTLESGEVVMAGGSATGISSEVLKDTRNPEELMINTSNSGYTVYVTGTINLEDEKRFLETSPINVEIPIGPIILNLENVRIFGEIEKDAQGMDALEGTLTFSGVSLKTSNGITEYDGETTPFTMDWVPEALAPVGHPLVCSDLCGAITGACAPPDDFPRENFCEEWAAAQ